MMDFSQNWKLLLFQQGLAILKQNNTSSNKNSQSPHFARYFLMSRRHYNIFFWTVQRQTHYNINKLLKEGNKQPNLSMTKNLKHRSFLVIAAGFYEMHNVDSVLWHWSHVLSKNLMEDKDMWKQGVRDWEYITHFLSIISLNI